MSSQLIKELTNHITTLLGEQVDSPRARWAIALAHHNQLTIEECTIEALDELMSPDSETVGDWLSYLAQSGHAGIFSANLTLFKPAKGEEEAELAANAPFMDSIEVAGRHYVYDWSNVAENLHCPDVPAHDDYMAGQWATYVAGLLG